MAIRENMAIVKEVVVDKRKELAHEALKGFTRGVAIAAGTIVTKEGFKVATKVGKVAIKTATKAL